MNKDTTNYQVLEEDIVEIIVPAAVDALFDWGVLGCGSQHN